MPDVNVNADAVAVADLDATVEGAVLAEMDTMGEACTSAHRSLVHSSVLEGFSSRLGRRTTAPAVGREGGLEGTEEYLDTTYVPLPTTEA